MGEKTIDDAAGFWLPPDFLTDDNFNDRNFSAVHPPASSLRLQVSRSSAIGSPISSTDTEPDQEELLAELSRQLARSSLLSADSAAPNLNPSSQTLTRDATECPQKPWMQMATSPQSTLTGFPDWTLTRNGGVSHVSSPPTTPPSELELLYAAAGQVARMRMNAATQAQMCQLRNRGLMLSQRKPTVAEGQNATNIGCGFQSHHQAFSFNLAQQNRYHEASHGAKQQVQQQQQQLRMLNRGRCCGGCCCGGAGGVSGLAPSAWPPLRCAEKNSNLRTAVDHENVAGGGESGSAMRAVLLGGPTSGVKKPSAGTGVFLPRRYGAVPACEPRKKTGFSTVFLPARVVQALNLNPVVGSNAHELVSRQQTLHSDHDHVILARKKAAAAVGWGEQQRRSVMRPAEGGMMNNEILLLPQEWTY